MSGCTACKAKAVGPPLVRPKLILPTYMPLLLSGLLLFMTIALLVVSIVFKLIGLGTLPEVLSSLSVNLLRLAFLSVLWQSKWVLLPLSVVAIWTGWRVGSRVVYFQKLYCRPRLTLFAGSVLATLGIFIIGIIGAMVPDHLRLMQDSRNAGRAALLYTGNRLLLEYRDRYGTYPGTLGDLIRLPAADGAVARVLAEFDPNGYKPTSFQARLPKDKGTPLRGVSLRRISAIAPSEGTLEEGFSFTNYELVWPGEDRVLGTADDRVIKDGQIVEITPTTNADNQQNTTQKNR